MNVTIIDPATLPFVAGVVLSSGWLAALAVDTDRNV
jgi:hypothetical protein